ncbi:hypothetical protein BH09PSE2_BH09PSE2_23080 [soil metagenome]
MLSLNAKTVPVPPEAEVVAYIEEMSAGLASLAARHDRLDLAAALASVAEKAGGAGRASDPES